MKEKVKQTLRFAESESNKTMEELVDLYETELEDMKSRTSAEITEEQLARHAAEVVKNDVTNMTGSSFGGGEVEELPVLALGYTRRESEYFFTDGDALIGCGIINPADDPAGISTFILDEEHGVDLDHAANAFEPLKTTLAYVSRRQVGSMDNEPRLKKAGLPTYVCNSTGQTKLEVTRPQDADPPLSELPETKEAKREMINENFVLEEDYVTVASYAEHESVQNANGFEIGVGVDIKRIRGQIADVYANDESGFGTMTILDDSVTENDVPEDLITDEMRTPGLQVFMEPDLIEHGVNSLVDVYGYVEQREDTGQYRMNGFGYVPIVEYDLDSGGNGSTGDDPAKEDTL
ncbi:MAG: hypothetical protein ABEK59_01240 [Halobacteria archaeon]